MKLDEILHSAGKYKKTKRLGRGTGSGQGKTSGRGTKGAGARAGWHARLGKEGGQNPIHARIPKRGFSNAGFRKVYQVVNVVDLEKFEDGSQVDAAALCKAGLVRDADKPIKVLGDGELKKKLTVVVDKLSTAAAAKIQQAGGTVQGEVVKPEEPKPKPVAKAEKPPKAEKPAKGEKPPKGAKGEAKDESAAPSEKPVKAKKEKAPKAPPKDAQAGGPAVPG